MAPLVPVGVAKLPSGRGECTPPTSLATMAAAVVGVTAVVASMAIVATVSTVSTMVAA